MKSMKLIYPLALALAVTLGATGCKHQPVKLTPLPGSPQATVGGGYAGGPLAPSQPFTPDGGGGSGLAGGTGIPVADASLFDGMKEQRDALASYTVHFAFDSAAVKSSEKSKLQAVASALTADTTMKLKIEGNCDERGTDEYNRSLGERRALALREALAKLGLSPDRVKTVSFGKDKPVDPGHDESAWSQNRRGDFVELLPVSDAPKP